MTGSHVRPWLAWLGVVAVALVALAAGAAAQPDEPPDVTTDPDTFAVESYAQNCSRCHGLSGNGGNVPADGRPVPALVGNPDVTVPYLDLVMRTGRMPPAGDPFDNRERLVVYDDAERSAMVAWMAQEFGIEGEIPEVGEGSVARGLEVFARNCAHCHGNAGAGGTAGQRAFTPQVSDRSGVAIVEAIRVGPFEMPAFGDDVIADRDADSVVAYLQAVEEERGTFLLGLVELNPVFASGFVAVLALALLGSLVYVGSRPVPLESVVRGFEESSPSTESDPDAADPDTPDPDTPDQGATEADADPDAKETQGPADE